MIIRTYQDSDKAHVLNLLRENTPLYFAPNEEIDFERYLEKEIEDYFVVTQNSEIVGCGGINYFNEQRIARLSWDIVKPSAHGKGYGLELTVHRRELLKKNKNVDVIVVRTSQHTYIFYEKMGFELSNISENFWAIGFDLYEMTLTLKSNL